jgi:hypothetical protein
VLAETHVGAGGVLHASGVPLQAPLAQLSLLVHASPSSHPAPSAYAYEHEPFEQMPAGW